LDRGAHDATYQQSADAVYRHGVSASEIYT